VKIFLFKMENIYRTFKSLWCALILLLASTLVLSAQTISWKGHVWNVNAGDGIGDAAAGAQIKGSAKNVTVDAKGYLHLKISGTGAGATGAEIFSADRIGFGSVYYVIEGPLTSMQKSVVASGFLYGPAAKVGKDGENELDIEFSRWNGTAGDVNADFTFYPNTGEAARKASYEENFLLDLKGATVVTCRIDWNATEVTASIWSGVVPPTEPVGTALKTHTYHGDAKTIPQQACPMMFNLWTYGEYPTAGVEVVVRDFRVIPDFKK